MKEWFRLNTHLATYMFSRLNNISSICVPILIRNHPLQRAVNPKSHSITVVPPARSLNKNYTLTRHQDLVLQGLNLRDSPFDIYERNPPVP